MVLDHRLNPPGDDVRSLVNISRPSPDRAGRYGGRSARGTIEGAGTDARFGSCPSPRRLRTALLLISGERTTAADQSGPLDLVLEGDDIIDREEPDP